MGLTIHYQIEADKDWTRRQIREKLEETRRFAMSLPVLAVSEVAEFRGGDCGFDRDRTNANEDPFRWAKVQAGRSVESPWRPGASQRQAPSHMLCLCIDPAEGSEPMNVGCCSFPRFVWAPDQNHLPNWSLVFRRGSYRESAKIFRAFLARYRLVKIPEPHGRGAGGWGRSEMLHSTLGGSVWLRSGRYLSHRKGYAAPHAELQLADYAMREIRFRFRGTVDESRGLFTSPQFKADLEDILYGQEHVVPAVHGVWSSFCKTQYSNDPRCGGWENFQRAHLSVVAVLEHMQEIGFEVHVSDEGGFWESRNLAKLAKTIGEWDAMVAGMAGMLKDAAEANGQALESPVFGRGDFERLEARGWKIDRIASHLEKLQKAIVPQAAMPA